MCRSNFTGNFRVSTKNIVLIFCKRSLHLCHNIYISRTKQATGPSFFNLSQLDKTLFPLREPVPKLIVNVTGNTVCQETVNRAINCGALYQTPIGNPDI